mgnify:CR=1 FL=1
MNSAELTRYKGMNEVLSAEFSLISRVPHGDGLRLKYVNGSASAGTPMSRIASGYDYYDIDAQKYREALKRLEKAKKELSPIHAELLEQFVYHIIAENHSPHDIYTKVSRLSRFLKWLKTQGKDITTCSGVDVYKYLVREINPFNRHRVAADIKRFVKYLMENVDASYERLYKSFRVKKPKEYPLPPLPPDELIEKVLQYSSTFYRAFFAVLYEGGLRLGEALSLRSDMSRTTATTSR